MNTEERDQNANAQPPATEDPAIAGVVEIPRAQYINPLSAECLYHYAEEILLVVVGLCFLWLRKRSPGE